MSKEVYLLAFIRRSKRRQDILKLLLNQNYTVVDITKQTGMYKSHVSRSLSELKERNLVKCLNPKDRAYRYYKITKKGREIISKLNL